MNVLEDYDDEEDEDEEDNEDRPLPLTNRDRYELKMLKKLILDPKVDWAEKDLKEIMRKYDEKNKK